MSIVGEKNNCIWGRISLPASKSTSYKFNFIEILNLWKKVFIVESTKTSNRIFADVWILTNLYKDILELSENICDRLSILVALDSFGKDFATTIEKVI